MNFKHLALLGLTVSSLLLPTQVTAQSASSSANQAQKIATLHSQCDSAISDRLNSLNTASSKINGLAKLSTDEKSKFNNSIQTNISGLNSQKTKCDADTDLNTLRT